MVIKYNGEIQMLIIEPNMRLILMDRCICTKREFLTMNLELHFDSPTVALSVFELIWTKMREIETDSPIFLDLDEIVGEGI